MKRLIFAFFVTILVSAPIFGANTDYQFIHFDKASSGLSYDGVKCLLQDSRGYVWAGTYKGLSRYDGTRWRNFDRHDFGTQSDYISSLAEDSDGNVWIGTDDGAVIYDFNSDCFSFFNSSDAPTDRIYDIESAENGCIYLGVKNQGIFRYSDGSFTRMSVNSNDNIYRIKSAPGGKLYYASYCDNLYVCSLTDSLIIDNNVVIDSLFAADDIEGLACYGDYLYVASKRSGLVRVSIFDSSPNVICPLQGDARPVNVSSSGGCIWFCTTDGIRCYNPANEQLTEIRMVPDDPFSLSGNFVTDVFVDRSNGLWVSADEGGVNYSSRKMDRFRRFRCGSGVKSFAQGQDGRVWVGTDRSGLCHFNPEKDTEVSSFDSAVLPRDINALCCDGDFLWIGSHRGLYCLNTETGNVRAFSSLLGSDKNLDNRVLCIFLSREKSIYVGTNIGVSRYNRETGKFEQIPSLSGITVESMGQDIQGNIWMATYSQGVYVFNPTTDSISASYNSKYDSSCIPEMISSICIDSRGSVWVIGFSSGFFRKVGDNFVQYDRSSLSMLPTDVYFTGISDFDGYVWLSSDKGLVKYYPHTRKVAVYTVSDGLLSNKFKKGGLLLKDGRIVMGSENGFIMFNPRDLSEDNSLMSVAITGASIAGEQPSQYNYSGNIDLTDRIVLTSRQRNIVFEFSIPGKSGISSGIILCRLDGVDNDWVNVSDTRRKEYFNLPKGTHTLHIASPLSDSRIGRAHKDVEIVVRPRFFESALGIACIVFVSVIIMSFLFTILYKKEISRQKARHKAKENALKEDLYHEKMSFFANVIHEIKTPLTLIRTPLQHLILNDEISMSSREDIALISNNTDYLEKLVKELLEFISLEEHGYVLEMHNLNLVERLGFIRSNYLETAKSRNLQMAYTYSSDNIETAVDTRAFNKMVNNLLSNAVKYADSYVSVDISLHDGKVVVSFRNDGELIPKNHRESIFTPFVHYGTENQRDDSFGIGLSYARKLARLHHGDITLSRRDDCNEFILTLPLTKVMEDYTEELSGPVADEITTGKPLLLIVEDNADLLGYLKRKLFPDFSVIGVNSAEKALERLRTNKVDLILTDLSLKTLSGVELCAKVSGSPKYAHIPIIILSAISTLQTKIKCMEKGATMYIEKPFSLDYLISCINAVLAKRKSIKEAYSTISTSVLDSLQADLPDRDDDFIRRLDMLISENISDANFSNKEMEQCLGVSRSSLNRKVKSLLGTTPNEYIRRKRLEIAAQILHRGGVRVSEICYAVGFNSPSYFAKCFKEKFGVLPAEYAKGKNVAESEE